MASIKKFNGTIWEDSTPKVWNEAEDILVNNLTTQEYNGLTLTRNADGSVRVQGTATANSNFYLCNDGHSAILASYQIIDNGIYYTGGGIEGGEEGKFILSAAYDDAIGGTAARRFRIPYGENIRIDNSTGAYKYLSIYIAVWNSATVDFTCKPYLSKDTYTGWHDTTVKEFNGTTWEYEMSQALQNGNSLSAVQSTAQPTSAGDNNADIM